MKKRMEQAFRHGYARGIDMARFAGDCFGTDILLSSLAADEAKSFIKGLAAGVRTVRGTSGLGRTFRR